GQHAFGERHRAHVEVALSEAQLVPLAHQVAAAYLAELVGGQPADVGEELEPGHGLDHHARLEHGIAVDHRHHRIAVRHLTGNGAKAVGQAVALAGAGDAHDVQADLRRRLGQLPEAADQQLIGQLDDRADHGARVATGNGFANHRAVDHGGGQRLDAKAGDQQEHVRGVGVPAEFFNLAAIPGVHQVKEQAATHEVHGAHGITPDADDADQQEEVPRLGVEHRTRQGQRQQHQQAEVEHPAAGLVEAVLEFVHIRLRPLPASSRQERAARLPADAFGHAIAGVGHETDQVDHPLAAWRLLYQAGEALIVVAEHDDVGLVDHVFQVAVEQRR